MESTPPGELFTTILQIFFFKNTKSYPEIIGIVQYTFIQSSSLTSSCSANPPIPGTQGGAKVAKENMLQFLKKWRNPNNIVPKFWMPLRPASVSFRLSRSPAFLVTSLRASSATFYNLNLQRASFTILHWLHNDGLEYSILTLTQPSTNASLSHQPTSFQSRAFCGSKFSSVSSERDSRRNNCHR